MITGTIKDSGTGRVYQIECVQHENCIESFWRGPKDRFGTYQCRFSDREAYRALGADNLESGRECAVRVFKLEIRG